MVRAPCCDKMGLKRGPWTPEEDELLIAHINKWGHSNWRALPKQAGLMRCGKSCRLRWTNYLRPDIKRGNFSREEEDTIIRLHSTLGNRWSAIAARLPGRTDNEIKNVWHTHLKKRLKQTNSKISSSNVVREVKSEKIDFRGGSDFCFESTSPQPSSSATDASVISWETYTSFNAGPIPSIDRSLSIESSSWVENSYQTIRLADESSSSIVVESNCLESSNLDDCMDFWLNLLLRADEVPELREI